MVLFILHFLMRKTISRSGCRRNFEKIGPSSVTIKNVIHSRSQTEPNSYNEILPASNSEFSLPSTA